MRAPETMTERMKNISHNNLRRPFEELFLQAFINADGNQSAAARLLGISREAWYDYKRYWVPPLTTQELQAEYERLGGHWYCHYNGSATTYSLIGYSLAEALNGTNIDEITPNIYAGHAATPPMGWNSWNAFGADINEEKIKAIADTMVSSGMRDAGYKYLVLDDGWMAAERDENESLVADANKLPDGMKAIGDYIHSKSLKYGIYEDRGAMTCQQLPGSFEHERIDMETFAS